MTAREAAAQLEHDYSMDADRALRAVSIARWLGLNREPVPGGYVTITAAETTPQVWDYTITPDTGPSKRRKTPGSE